MTKRNWMVKVPGYPAFSMVVMTGPMNHAEALREARGIWPTCEIAE